jgi:hypothetical protein
MTKDDYDNHDYDNPSDDDYGDPAWQHGAAIHEPLSWYCSSEDLEAAAAILQEKVEEFYKNHDKNSVGESVMGPYYMLTGFAMECLLKGIIVANGERVLKNGKIKFIDSGNQHDLIKLADKAGVIYNSVERRMLKLLTENAEWAGRYPTPQRWDQECKKIEPSHYGVTMESITEPYSNHDIPIIDRLYYRVKGVLESKLPLHENKTIVFTTE